MASTYTLIAEVPRNDPEAAIAFYEHARTQNLEREEVCSQIVRLQDTNAQGFAILRQLAARWPADFDDTAVNAAE